MLLDIHIHSRYSDGRNSPEEIVRHAKNIKLGGIAITDHNEIQGSLEALRFNSPDFRVIPGMEVSSLEGHILALGVKELIEKDLPAEETIEKIHSLGGIAIAIHPYDRLRAGVGDLIYSLDFDAVELYNGHTLSSSKNPEEIKKRIDKPVVGGSDAHSLDEMGSITIETGENPLESILKGDVRVEVNTNKLKILRSYTEALVKKGVGKVF